jgi:hypothetical protein
MATGDQSGSWGTVTNTNLELIAEAFSFGTEGITTNADTHTTTIADGATDPGRSMFLKYTGTLDSACTITIAPNTVSKLWFIENATSGSQNIIISQGSGANVTIPAGDTKAIYSDGAGSGAAMVDAFASLSVVDLNVSGNLDVDGTANLDAVDIDGAVQLDATFTVGANDQGYDVTLHGDTDARNVKWDSSADSLLFSDNAKAIFGDELEIHSDATHARIREFGSGQLKIQGDNMQLLTSDGASTYVEGVASTGVVTLYHASNAPRLATSSTGISVTGKLETSANNNGGAKANYIRITDTDTTATAGNQQGGIEFYTNDVTPGIAASIEVVYAGSGGGGEITLNTNASSSGTLTEALRINENGLVGIGTDSPSALMHISGGSTATDGIHYIATNTSNGPAGIVMNSGHGNWKIINSQTVANALEFIDGGSPDATRMRIEPSGKVIIGVNPNDTYSQGFSSLNGKQDSSNDSTASRTHYEFRNPNGAVGTIATSGSATAYNTSSDYRLKTDAQPITNASDRVLALNPVNFEWIADGTRVDGFLAHEAATVVPEAVTGTKDAMRDEEYEVTPAVLDDDGNETAPAVMGTRSVPDLQGIDQSKMVPLLVAALQDALARITALENA